MSYRSPRVVLSLEATAIPIMSALDRSTQLPVPKSKEALSVPLVAAPSITLLIAYIIAKPALLAVVVAKSKTVLVLPWIEAVPIIPETTTSVAVLLLLLFVLFENGLRGFIIILLFEATKRHFLLMQVPLIPFVSAVPTLLQLVLNLPTVLIVLAVLVKEPVVVRVEVRVDRVVVRVVEVPAVVRPVVAPVRADRPPVVLVPLRVLVDRLVVRLVEVLVVSVVVLVCLVPFRMVLPTAPIPTPQALLLEVIKSKLLLRVLVNAVKLATSPLVTTVSSTHLALALFRMGPLSVASSSTTLVTEVLTFVSPLLSLVPRAVRRLPNAPRVATDLLRLNKSAARRFAAALRVARWSQTVIRLPLTLSTPARTVATALVRVVMAALKADIPLIRGRNVVTRAARLLEAALSFATPFLPVAISLLNVLTVLCRALEALLQLLRSLRRSPTLVLILDIWFVRVLASLEDLLTAPTCLLNVALVLPVCPLLVFTSPSSLRLMLEVSVTLVRRVLLSIPLESLLVVVLTVLPSRLAARPSPPTLDKQGHLLSKDLSPGVSTLEWKPRLKLSPDANTMSRITLLTPIRLLSLAVGLHRVPAVAQGKHIKLPKVLQRVL